MPQVKEMEHIDAQEHFGDCKECQKIFARQRKQAQKEVVERIIEKLPKKMWGYEEIKQLIKNL